MIMIQVQDLCQIHLTGAGVVSVGQCLEEENKCCGKRLCVTSYQTFRDGCINRHALELAIKSRSDMRVEQFEFTTNDYRKAAHRQFVAWKYGRLGQGVRKINPSCVVLMVRQAYPSHEYMGFRPH